MSADPYWRTADHTGEKTKIPIKVKTPHRRESLKPHTGGDNKANFM